jgi:hypothetical protein
LIIKKCLKVGKHNALLGHTASGRSGEREREAREKDQERERERERREGGRERERETGVCGGGGGWERYLEVIDSGGSRGPLFSLLGLFWHSLGLF